MSILTPSEHAQWEEDGYFVIRDFLPGDKVRACVDAIWDFLRMDPDRPESWYRGPNSENLPHVLPRKKGALLGLVDLYHHQALWDIRQYPPLHQIFAELWKTEALWVSFDRCAMNPPARPGDWDYQGEFHCDVDPLDRPPMLETRSVIYLGDTPAERGAFQFVPGFHRHLDDWLKHDPAVNIRILPDVSGLTTRKVEGRAGDLIVFNAILPHRNTRNTTSEPRLAALNTFFPSPEAPSSLQRHRWPRDQRESRVEAFQKRMPISATMVARVNELNPNATEAARYGGTPLVLSELGEKLVGLKPW